MAGAFGVGNAGAESLLPDEFTRFVFNEVDGLIIDRTVYDIPAKFRLLRYRLHRLGWSMVLNAPSSDFEVAYRKGDVGLVVADVQASALATIVPPALSPTLPIMNTAAKADPVMIPEIYNQIFIGPYQRVAFKVTRPLSLGIDFRVTLDVWGLQTVSG